MKVISGQLNGQGKKIVLLVSRFNEFITQKLIGGAEDMLKRHGVKDDDISVVWTPGAFEIPAAAKKLSDSGKFDAIICLGCVIRGATPHFEYVSAEAAKGIAAIGMNSKIPIIFGILTTENIEQAIERAGTKSGNRGADAALTAIEMIDLYSQIQK
ncbi:MAG: 6,7-dimethyl-8-ribityllumazine synthase [Elusimicrobiota bacterium]|jgi:6,7-dimethyl-8-ribityllumazine synthase|nr:6,7-dimethyl-8-ribityllumazine synthase [Elusimicrobiota bacterium]